MLLKEFTVPCTRDRASLRPCGVSAGLSIGRLERASRDPEGCNLDTPLYARNKNTVETVDCKDGTGSKKAKTVFSAGKVMATVFWDSFGVILIDYLQEEKTITRAYCASLLDKLQIEFAEKWPHLQKKKILFHQDNAPSHLTPQRLSWRKSTNYGLNP
ncbi:histone-lysine N-methyltransferase SETMAR [Trichonephila clavipes]|nr:histone-lysine N-methyltransferase SETMAR [Trichonephila clavipes]